MVFPSRKKYWIHFLGELLPLQSGFHPGYAAGGSSWVQLQRRAIMVLKAIYLPSRVFFTARRDIARGCQKKRVNDRSLLKFFFDVNPELGGDGRKGIPAA